MKIIYLTTAMEKVDFNSFQKHWRIPINPSNQNFHNKLIRSLAINNDVLVISLRPFSRTLCDLKRLDKSITKENNIIWHYAKVSASKTMRYLTNTHRCIKALNDEDLSDAIIITDTINPKIVNVARKLSKKFKLPIIGVCTDSPSNISGVSKTYKSFLLKNCENLSGYIALTHELNFLFNPKEKPSIIIEGIVENNSSIASIDDSRYFFFGGAMLPRYGIYNLIEAFKKLNNNNTQLVICGHHYDEKKLFAAINGDPRIKFLGILSVDEVRNMQSHALGCINPRPFSEDLDRYSIPSKTIESLSSGSVTISVKNSKLQKLFPNDVIWAKSGSPEDLKIAMEKVLELSNDELQKMAEKAKEKVTDMFSLEATNTKVNNLLLSIKR